MWDTVSCSTVLYDCHHASDALFFTYRDPFPRNATQVGPDEELRAGDFSPVAKSNGAVAGLVNDADACVVDGDDSACAHTDDVSHASEKAAKDATEASRRLAKEAHNAPGLIEKIQRALEVLDKEVAKLDAALVSAGSDAGKAMEIQQLKDVKTAKQEVYYTEWSRLEELIAAAEGCAAAAR